MSEQDNTVVSVVDTVVGERKERKMGDCCGSNCCVCCSVTKCLNDQDTNQKMNVLISVCVEFYRVLVSCLLLVFVPQGCNGHVCTYSENVSEGTQKYNACLALNFLTMFSFVLMYIFEVKRENRLITYLEVNKTLPCSDESVGLVLEKLPKDKRESIWSLDYYYQRIAYTSMFLFVGNTVFSGLIVYDYYLDNQTTTTFVTNVMFMLTKINDVYTTVNTDKNVFYSAYLKGKVQFNDVDPDKLIELTPLKEEKKEQNTDVDVKLDIEGPVAERIQNSSSDSITSVEI